METKNFKLNLGGRELIIEIRDLAEQANGSAMVRYGDTLVLSTCVASKEDREGLDFFPLTVEYEERYYAAGKIRGPRYIKRESRPSDEAVITGRLIDRAIRPRFPKGLKRDVQVINTCLSWDATNEPGILGLMASSVALSISDIPWSGPIGVVRVGKVDGNFILNPTYEERDKSEFDLVLAGIEEKDEILVNMIEADAQETSEENFLEAINFGKKYLKEVIDFQKEIIKEVGKEKITIISEAPDLEFEKQIKEFLGNKLENALYKKEKQGRTEEINELKEELIIFIEEKYPAMGKIKSALNFFEKENSGKLFSF